MGNILKNVLYSITKSRGGLEGFLSNMTEIEEYPKERELFYILFKPLWWLTYLLSFLGIVLVTFMTKRKFCCLKCLNGYFGLAVPVNFLETRQQRKAFLAAFALCSISVVNKLHHLAYIISDFPFYTKILVKLIMISIVTCQFLPLFAFIYMGTMPGYIIGLIYHLFFMVFSILKKIPGPNVSVMTAFRVLTLRFLIIVIAGNYLVYWFVKQIRRLYHKKNFDKAVPKSQIKYVRHLLLPKERYLKAQSDAALEEKKGSKLVLWFRKNIYRNVPGFRYSLTILVSCTVGLFGITHIFSMVFHNAVENLLDVLQLLDLSDHLKEEIIPNYVDMIIRHYTSTETTDEEELIQKSGSISAYDFIYTQSIIIVAGSLLAVVVAYILGMLSICHLLTSYRENVLNLRKRKERQAILHITKEFSNVALVVSAIQFAGFQVAYIIFGFSLQAFLLTVLFITLGEVIVLPIQFALSSYLIKVMEIITPIVMALILIPTIQRLLVTYLFLEDRGKTMALNNRRGFFIMTYVMFFHNIFAGAFSCTRRIAKGALLGILFIPRLDKSSFPRAFEHTDPAFRAYSCLLHLEALQSNPIVKAFVSILMKKQSFRLIKQSEIYTDRKDFLYPKLPKQKQVALNRWFVAYTMIRNYKIITFRNRLDTFNILEVYANPYTDETKSAIYV